MNPKHTPASQRGIDHQYVLSRFSYDAETGALWWRIGQFAGRPAGTRNINGAMQVRLHGVLYLTHRLIWFIAYGKWPDQQIDHINGDRGDNRLCNLRDVSQSVNMQNLRRAVRGSRLGVLGVRQLRCGRFQALITVGGKPRGLGGFATPEEAHAAYIAAKRKFHPGCTI